MQIIKNNQVFKFIDKGMTILMVTVPVMMMIWYINNENNKIWGNCEFIFMALEICELCIDGISLWATYSDLSVCHWSVHLRSLVRGLGPLI